MSAYVMEPREIAAIGEYFDQRARRTGNKVYCYRKTGKPRADYTDNYFDGQRIADTLMLENVRSVNYRYNERNRAPQVKLDPHAPEHPPGYVALLLRRWDYQANERKDYYRGPARELYVALIEDLVDDLMRATI